MSATLGLLDPWSGVAGVPPRSAGPRSGTGGVRAGYGPKWRHLEQSPDVDDLHDSSCSNPSGTGPDRLHRFTAPSAGRLRLRLQQGPNDLALAVYDACGVPADMAELGCSSVVDVEEVEVDLAAGQTITAVVDGFSADNQGPYQLEAAFTPD